MSYWLLVVDGAGAGVRRRHHAGLAACLGGACVLLTAVRYEQTPNVDLKNRCFPSKS